MSGPKISVYSLERERRRLLESIRKCDQQRTELIIENSQLIADLNQMLQDICKDSEKIASLHRKTENSQKHLQSFSEMESLLSDFIQDAVSEQSSNKPAKNSKINPSREELQKHEDSLSQLKKINQNVKRIDDQIRSRYIALHKESVSNIREEILKRGSNTHIDFRSSAEKASVELENMKSRIISELECRISSGQYSQAILSNLDSIRLSIRNAPNKSSLKNYEELTLKHFYSQLESDAAKNSRYRILREAYLQACDEMQISPDPTIPDCGDAVKIEAAIQEVNQMLIKKDVRSYIIDMVDEVMCEMGYDVIGSRDVTKKNGRSFHDELYSYSAGTAINVIYSSDGQITMELGGLSRNDEFPDNSKTDLLTEEMHTFCSSFSIIEKKLAERGVLVGRRISLAPPDAEYAMTINLNDYQLKKNNIQTLQEAMDQEELDKTGKNRDAKRMTMD